MLGLAWCLIAIGLALAVGYPEWVDMEHKRLDGAIYEALRSSRPAGAYQAERDAITATGGVIAGLGITVLGIVLLVIGWSRGGGTEKPTASSRTGESQADVPTARLIGKKPPWEK